MKKALPVVVVVLLLLVAGYFLKGAKKSGLPATNNQGGSVFTSIKDALSKSMSLKCVYKDDKGVETTSYIKDGSVRVMTSGTGDADQYGSILMRDKKMYMWSDVTKKGFTLSLKEPENVSPGAQENKPDSVNGAGQDQESVLAQIEKYKDACKVEVIADSYFTVPTDVEFQDMDALQKQMMQGLPSNQDEISGSAPGGADYEKYIQDAINQAQDEGQ